MAHMTLLDDISYHHTYRYWTDQLENLYDRTGGYPIQAIPLVYRCAIQSSILDPVQQPHRTEFLRCYLRSRRELYTTGWMSCISTQRQWEAWLDGVLPTDNDLGQLIVSIANESNDDMLWHDTIVPLLLIWGQRMCQPFTNFEIHRHLRMLDFRNTPKHPIALSERVFENDELHIMKCVRLISKYLVKRRPRDLGEFMVSRLYAPAVVAATILMRRCPINNVMAGEASCFDVIRTAYIDDVTDTKTDFLS